MSVTMERPPTSWRARPGWGISVDLTPHQVVEARQVKIHQRLIALALLLVLLACVGATLLSRADRDEAKRDHDTEQGRTAELSAAVAKYADITAMEGVTTRVQGDLTTVMGADVDVVNLLARVNSALPPGVRVSDQSVVLTPPVEATTTPTTTTDPAATDAAAAQATVDTQVIGTLTLSGTADRITDVTPFVSMLNRLRGAVDVLPTSISQGAGGATYTITANLTGSLYTDRYAKDAQ